MDREMAVSTLSIVVTPKPHALQTFNPKLSLTFKPSNATYSCSSFRCSSSLNSNPPPNNVRRVLDIVGLGLLASSVVALLPLDASATRIEYYATVAEPPCELNFARSGLGYCDLAVGSGEVAPLVIHYTARFADGIVFDSSYKRGRPLTMRIGLRKVIKGLDQGILGGDGVPPMLVGGRRKLQIPPKLAYGPEPAGCFSGDCNIPANATLVAVHEGLLSGFTVGSPMGSAIRVSHLLYADDALVFCDAEVAQLGFLRCVLVYFEAVSGLRINLSKSELIPVGEVGQLPVLAAVLGCKVATLPVTYLGLPLGASFKAKGVWDGVLDRVQRRLAGWKQQYLSKGGRLTLIKSVLSSILTYFMSLHVIPVSVAARLEKLQRDFLWGVVERILNITWWIGGGFVSRRRVVASKFGVDVRDWQSGKDRQATVASYLGTGEVVVWDIQFRREVQDWEFNQLGELFAFLYGLGLLRRGEDGLVWNVVSAKDAETVDHLFLHYSLTSRLWGLVCSLFGITWVQPKGVVDMLWSWRGARIGRSRRQVSVEQKSEE
ncbi:unnamed protein product [Camellia sinensis]